MEIHRNPTLCNTKYRKTAEKYKEILTGGGPDRLKTGLSVTLVLRGAEGVSLGLKINEKG